MSNDEYTPIGDQRYQEKVVQALFQDYLYAEQISDIVKPEFFSQKHLSEIVKIIFEYRAKYTTYPSSDVVLDILNKNGVNDIIKNQALTYIDKIKQTPLNGDMSYIQDTSIDFCRRQSLLEGINVALVEIEKNNFDTIFKIITDAAMKGATRELGKEYTDGFESRAIQAERDPVKLPWPVINNLFGGGADRSSLVTFIGPTGAGKTHFLTNVSAAGIEAGYNVVYVTLEMAAFKIELRHDAYFSGININNVPKEMERVEKEVRNINPQGKLFVKEFPTKGATVSTIRSYLQRLKTVKGIVPDILVLDYAALLRAPKIGKDNTYHDLESVYADLRGLAQEFNLLLVTADQTNRSGLNAEIVTLESIADAYNRATVCDAIMTISRTLDDKSAGTGRIFIAKSRFGADGIVLPFTIDTAKVRIRILREAETVEQAFKETEENQKKKLAERFQQLKNGKQ